MARPLVNEFWRGLRQHTTKWVCQFRRVVDTRGHGRAGPDLDHRCSIQELRSPCLGARGLQDTTGVKQIALADFLAYAFPTVTLEAVVVPLTVVEAQVAIRVTASGSLTSGPRGGRCTGRTPAKR